MGRPLPEVPGQDLHEEYSNQRNGKCGVPGQAQLGTCELRRWVRGEWVEGLRPEMLAGADQEALVSHEGNVAFIQEVPELWQAGRAPPLSVMDAC